MYSLPKWPINSPSWEEHPESIALLREGTTGTKLASYDLKEILKQSDKFPIKFPIDTILCKTLKSTVDKSILQRNINSAYPLIHEYALYLCVKFILFKRKYGTDIEKNLYKNMSIIEFIDRLLIKRAVMFMGKWDSWILITGEKGAGKWDTIGKPQEKNPLLLQKCISYDEIKLSVFLSVSSYSYFINNGTRKNNGIPAKTRNDLQPEGIVIGLIGARLKRKNAMEYQEIVITKTQNTSNNGYGINSKESLQSIFANMYQEPNLTYDDVQDNERFTKLPNEEFFDNFVYSKRLALSFDTLLLEANVRAKIVNKTAYVHVVGIGLGVWKASDHQKQIFVETFLNRIKHLGDKLNHVSDIDFAYIGDGINLPDYKNGNIIKTGSNSIKIHVSKRDPYTKIESGKLLVVSYAWDGNAQPGNEFWKGLLGSTGDSSTASSTQVTELHNPHINHMVNAKNLMVVTPDGHISIQEYIKKITTRSDDTKTGENPTKTLKKSNNLL